MLAVCLSGGFSHIFHFRRTSWVVLFLLGFVRPKKGSLSRWTDPEGARDQQADRCRVCSDAFAVPVCHGEIETKPKGEPLDLLVSLCSYSLTYGHVLWVITKRSQIQATIMSFVLQVAGRT